MGLMMGFGGERESMRRVRPNPPVLGGLYTVARNDFQCQ